MRIRIFLLLLTCTSLQSVSNEINSDVLLNINDVQVSSEINEYENITAGVPIEGSVMITHEKGILIDINRFFIGSSPLKVTFVQTVPMSEFSHLEVSIYQFQLPGMNAGPHTLPPIQVQVKGNTYQASPLIVNVG